MKIKYTLLLACILLAACSPQTLADGSTTEPYAEAPSETEESTLPPSEKTDAPLYEVLSPESIQTEGGILIELYTALIEIHPVSGALFKLGFRYTGLTEDQIPESGWEQADSPFIEDLQFFRGEDETPIRLEVIGAGGGQSPADSGALSLNQSQTYQFPADFVVGQTERIVVLVTFHEMLGIPETVRYELDLTPLQGPLG